MHMEFVNMTGPNHNITTRTITKLLNSVWAFSFHEHISEIYKKIGSALNPFHSAIMAAFRSKFGTLYHKDYIRFVRFLNLTIHLRDTVDNLFTVWSGTYPRRCCWWSVRIGTETENSKPRFVDIQAEGNLSIRKLVIRVHGVQPWEQSHHPVGYIPIRIAHGRDFTGQNLWVY